MPCRLARGGNAMRRRSRGGREPPKTRRRKTVTPKPLNAPKVHGRGAPVPDRETEVARLTRERDAALEQQAATSEVLQVISNSPSDLEPVFVTMLEKAVRICDATFGNIYRWDGEFLSLVAAYNTPTAFAEARRLPRRPDAKMPIGRMLSTKAAVHVADLVADESYVEQRIPEVIAAVELGGVRTFLAVPMLKDNDLIGALSLSRLEVRPFTDKQIELVKNFAAQAVIAIENARLLNELKQSLEQQTATADVLKTISRSTFDLQLVLDTLTQSAGKLARADKGAIWQRDREFLRLIANYGIPAEAIRYLGEHPLRADQSSVTGRAAVEGRAVHVADVASDPNYAAVGFSEVGAYRTVLGVPLLRDGAIIGVFGLTRNEVNPFTDKQIALVKTFADQAVIAIENARLLNELRQRTADLTEALEQQAATTDLLQIINRSPGDLSVVFEALTENAMHVCGAAFGVLATYDGSSFRTAAMRGVPHAYVQYRGENPPAYGPGTGPARMIAGERVVHVVDLRNTDAYRNGEPNRVALVELGGARTSLHVALSNEKALLGSITIYRQEVRQFSDKEIAVLQNFAAHAVIAIENARLLSELRERTGQLQAQSKELANLNQQLEQRVADQVGEIERMGRLRRFLPPQVADLIVASGTEKQLESHRREITALFCDLRGFTGFSESADPEDVSALLREYHAAIGEKIIKYSGTLERYAGDGVMVVFNDPVPVENPALQAVLMALEMRDAIGALTETWRRWGHDIGFGIGIAHGFATLGTIGFEGRFDYAAIGTVSNVASRLCDEAKPGQILISPRVLTKVEYAVKVEPVGEFELKGIRRPLAAYNILSAIA
jgi:GAF domain-containing protein